MKEIKIHSKELQFERTLTIVEGMLCYTFFSSVLLVVIFLCSAVVCESNILAIGLFISFFTMIISGIAWNNLDKLTYEEWQLKRNKKWLI